LGSLASTATNKSNFFTGTGVLSITTFVPSVLIGDYNNNGVVDAADYTTWRDNLGGATLTNRDPANTGAVTTADYTSWVTHFGNTAGPGSGAGLASGGAVPEPASIVLAALGVFGLIGAARRGRVRQ
jgi:PEP-CTERM motif